MDRHEASVIFAQLEYLPRYSAFHSELLDFVRERFQNVQSGLQGDSWIWIFEGEEKVAIDTFTAMKHQVKSAKAGPLVGKVIETLRSKYAVRVYRTPEREGHEGE